MGNGLEYDVAEVLHMLELVLKGVGNGEYDNERLSPSQIDWVRVLLRKCRLTVDLLHCELPETKSLSIGEWRQVVKSQVEEK